MNYVRSYKRRKELQEDSPGRKTREYKKKKFSKAIGLFTQIEEVGIEIDDLYKDEEDPCFQDKKENSRSFITTTLRSWKKLQSSSNKETTAPSPLSTDSSPSVTTSRDISPSMSPLIYDGAIRDRITIAYSKVKLRNINDNW